MWSAVTTLNLMSFFFLLANSCWRLYFLASWQWEDAGGLQLGAASGKGPPRSRGPCEAPGLRAAVRGLLVLRDAMRPVRAVSTLSFCHLAVPLILTKCRPCEAPRVNPPSRDLALAASEKGHLGPQAGGRVCLVPAAGLALSSQTAPARHRRRVPVSRHGWRGAHAAERAACC